MSVALFVIAALIVAVAILARRLGRLGERLNAVSDETRRRAESFEREAAELRRVNAQLQQDQQFFIHFLREFPHLTRGLHSGANERDIPSLLLNVAMRSFEPRQALVLLRRKKAESEPARASHLVVAAVASEDCPIKVGTEIRLGEGELGFAAETQRVMNRQDFDLEASLAPTHVKSGGSPSLAPDLVAPMVFEEETLGLIALAGVRRTSEDAKAALRLIAQAGAQAVHNTAAYTHMKTTADLDGLTRIFNKRHTTQVLAERIYEAQQQVKHLSVFLFDIDNFKNYNDVNGHVAGDRLLRMLAQLVQENVRKEDIFGRFGGEEFLLILPNTQLPQALGVAYKVRARIAAHDFPFAKRQPLGFVSVSGGVSEYPEDAMDSAGLLRAADQALYEAKRHGRNAVLAPERRYLGGEEPQVRTEGLAIDDLPPDPKQSRPKH